MRVDRCAKKPSVMGEPLPFSFWAIATLRMRWTRVSKPLAHHQPRLTGSIIIKSLYIYNIEVNPPISVQTGYITHSISMIFPSYPHCLSGWSILNPRWGSPVTIVMSPTNPPVTTRGPVYQLCSSIPKSPSFVGSIMSKSQWITIFDVKIPWHPRFFPWFCARPPAGSQSMVGGAAAATTRRGFWMGRTCWKLQK